MTITRRNHGQGHSYWVDGIPGFTGPVKLPGVTTILQMSPKPGLIKWAAETTAAAAVDYWSELAELKPSERLKRLNGARFEDRDTAARRGTEVHALAERLVNDEPVEVPDELTGHVEAYLQFLDEWEVDPLAVELVVVNRALRYCGTIDLVADLRGTTWLLEIKTSRSGVYAESALQACGYLHAERYTTPGEGGAEHPLAELGIERCGAVWVRGDGYDLIPLEVGAEVWAYFQHLRALHEADEARQEWTGPAIQPLRLVGS